MTLSDAASKINSGEATHARRRSCTNLTIWADSAGWLEIEFGCSLSIEDVAATDWEVSNGPFR